MYTLTTTSDYLEPDAGRCSKEQPRTSQHCPAEEVKVHHHTEYQEGKNLRGGGGGGQNLDAKLFIHNLI